ncbi:tyrosine-protein phosphatase MSG5 [Histoplasma capsulatum G186AR]|uniref:Tyrosine-protein phosphatase MSG5 n=1 Tax=Ajellomyces capsulatus TaxID=5037 RepID=A0A8H8CR70_AJECA|nr:tyrosine-protein phosphatase MSG5 [Histoplasma capsulatum]QSS70470.1 tyrosine-protein phosphatase MSG5 [Histoplasma capsulatum G186AR]
MVSAIPEALAQQLSILRRCLTNIYRAKTYPSRLNLPTLRLLPPSPPLILRSFKTLLQALHLNHHLLLRRFNPLNSCRGLRMAIDRLPS